MSQRPKAKTQDINIKYQVTHTHTYSTEHHESDGTQT